MNPIAQQPIQDVAPPRDSLGNPENYADVPVQPAPATTNPIAGPTLVRQAVPAAAPAPAKTDEDKVLKDVNKEVKAASRKPRQPTKPWMAVSLAMLIAIALSAAAVFAFKSN